MVIGERIHLEKRQVKKEDLEHLYKKWEFCCIQERGNNVTVDC